MELFSKVWTRSLMYLEEDLNMYVMKTWISELKPLKREENNYIFSVETPLQKSTIEERFFAAIISAMEEAHEEITGVYNGHIEMQIVLDSQAVIKEEKEEEKEQHMSVIPLDPKYTFETYVVGECNAFAAQMAKNVAENPGGKTLNPLFLYGGPSLGKSHLLHAIGNHILSENKDSKIVYVSSETFMNEFISMIRMAGKSSRSDVDFRQQFQKRYRDIDVLLIDDIQFFSGKEGIQDEFFHTFNDLYNHGKQIVITSDKQPRELEKMEERLLSRFEWGMTSDVKPPNYETRVAILMEKAFSMKQEDPDIPEIETEVFHFIASKVKNDIRKLEGALRKVIMYAEFSSKVRYELIDVKLAEAALAEYMDGTKSKIITHEYILDFVSKQYNITKDELMSKKRSKSIVYPRMISQYLMRNICDSTYESIAEFFSKDPSTIMHAEKQIKNEIDTKVETKNIIEDMITRIKE